MVDNKKFWKAALIRAFKTVCQTLAGAIPVGFVITPAMLHDADWSMFWIILAWLVTGLLSGLASILTNIFTGLPEVDDGKGANAISDGWPIDDPESDTEDQNHE